MVRAGLRRIVVIVVVVGGGTAALSAALGAAAGTGIDHALAVGFYLAGAAVLFGSLALGSRGPMRVDRSVERQSPLRPFGRRDLRKATPDERREARLASLGLFAFGLVLILVGALFDPARRPF